MLPFFINQKLRVKMNEKFSKIGFILAVAGSAVGLGNAWMFPTLVGQNGGSAFILLYIFLTLCVGFVIFLAELAIGKISGLDPANAYYTLAPKHKKEWSFVGFTMVGALLIVSFYSVVIGWVLHYIFASFKALPSDTTASKAAFTKLLSQDISGQLVCFTIVFVVVFYIVSRGIKDGIEKLNVWMMPSLFILLILMLGYSFSFDGFLQAFNFLINPDFTKLSSSSVLKALGLAFFSLSLGVGTIITYSASLPDKTNFVSSTVNIIIINIIIGIMMGLIVFTFIFEYGADPSQQGPGLIFISLTTLFAKLGIFGNILSFAFFAALLFAGITSAISMIEPFVFYLMNSFKFTRLKALVCIGIFVYILGSLCVLSNIDSTKAYLVFFNMPLFDFLNFLASNILMPFGGLAAAIFVGFILKRQASHDLFSPYMSEGVFSVWYFFLRYLSPLAVIIVVAKSFNLF